jgi:hypothetical protein
LDAVIDDETDISLKEVFDAGFEVLNEGEQKPLFNFFGNEFR